MSDSDGTTSQHNAVDPTKLIVAAWFDWNLIDDSIIWSGDSDAVFDRPDFEGLKTGENLFNVIDPRFTKSFAQSIGVFEKDQQGQQLPQYVMRLALNLGEGDNKQTKWVELVARWQAESENRPMRLIGMFRPLSQNEINESGSVVGIDPLSGQYNRDRLLAELRRQLNALEENSPSFAFIVMSINNLNKINEIYGYEVADEVISMVAQKTSSVMRRGDIIGRISGNKIAIIINNCQPNKIFEAANRFMQVVGNHVFDTSKGPLAVTISVAGTSVPDHASTLGEIMARSHQALTEAKRTNGAFMSSEEFKKHNFDVDRNRELASILVSSLKSDWFKLELQNIVEPATENVEMKEAFLRVQHPDGEVIDAGHFVKVAEDLGLMRLIDNKVLEIALRKLQEEPELNLSINVSSKISANAEFFAILIDKAMTHSNVVDRLIIEVKEATSNEELENTIRFIHNVKKLNCRVAIDNFGANNFSLPILRRCEIDFVKIDDGLTRKLTSNRVNQTIVRNILDLANVFECKVVAKSIEEEEVAKFLLGWGVDLVQGHYYELPQAHLPHNVCSFPLSPALNRLLG